MDHGGDVVSQGDHTQIQAHLHAAGDDLVNDLTHQEGHQALVLVLPDHLHHVVGIVRLAQHHGYAGDVAGDQGHAQRPDDGVGHEADTASLA